jgi:hypothetical protein
MDGVPSEVTIWRHLQRWELERHIAAYGQRENLASALR